MRLRLFNLVSREEIPAGAVPEGDWRCVSAGGELFALLSRSGRAAVFRVLPDGEGCEPVPVGGALRNLRQIAVPKSQRSALVCADLFGSVRLLTEVGEETRRFPRGVTAVAFGCVAAALTSEGTLYLRAYRSVMGESVWKDSGLAHIKAVSCGKSRLAALDTEGRIHLQYPAGTGQGFFELNERLLSPAEAVADGNSAVCTLREGRLCLNGRVAGAGTELESLVCGNSDELEFAVCRRRDGSFLTALIGGTYIPASLPMKGAERVTAYDAGDRFLACLTES